MSLSNDIDHELMRMIRELEEVFVSDEIPNTTEHVDKIFHQINYVERQIDILIDLLNERK